METASAIFYAENLVNGKRDNRMKSVVIHEVAHQWFGNAVTESTWDDAWLSEGFATYFTLLFQEYYYGSSVYTAELQKSRLRIFDYYKKDSTYKIVDNRTAEEGPVTNNMTYQKGAWFLHMLRNKMGPEAFMQGIRAYYRKFYNANATTDDFMAEMQKFCASPLYGFFNQWLKRPEVLNIKGSWQYDAHAAQLTITLQQLQHGDFIFDMPVEIEIIGEGNQSPQFITINLDSKSTTVKLPVSQKPVAILTDPNTLLLAKITFLELPQ
jgi:aminopeptidase N